LRGRGGGGEEGGGEKRGRRWREGKGEGMTHHQHGFIPRLAGLTSLLEALEAWSIILDERLLDTTLLTYLLHLALLSDAKDGRLFTLCNGTLGLGLHCIELVL